MPISICLFFILHVIQYVCFECYISLHTSLSRDTFYSIRVFFHVTFHLIYQFLMIHFTPYASFSCVLQFIQFVYSSRYILLNISIFHVKFHWIGIFQMLFWLSITNPYVKFHSICVVLVWHFTQYVSLKCYISLNMSIPHVTFHSVLLLYSTFH